MLDQAVGCRYRQPFSHPISYILVFLYLRIDICQIVEQFSLQLHKGAILSCKLLKQSIVSCKLLKNKTTKKETLTFKLQNALLFVYINVREYRRAITNGQSRGTGKIGYTRRRNTKQKHNKICVGHHYAHTNTNNTNKT